MKRKVAEGRFEPVGMMWLEPDCNVTGGEVAGASARPRRAFLRRRAFGTIETMSSGFPMSSATARRYHS